MKAILRAVLMLGGLAVAAAAENPNVQLLDQEFTLSVVDTREAFIRNEYVLPGETAKSWTQLLTVMHAPRTSKPAIAIRSLLKSALAGGLLTGRPLVVERDGVKKGDDVAVILVFKDPASGRLEYNVQRYVKEPGTIGVKSYQFVRHYAANAPNLPDTVELTFWLKALWALQTPVHAKPPK